jgi:hypothetical protein
MAVRKQTPATQIKVAGQNISSSSVASIRSLLPQPHAHNLPQAHDPREFTVLTKFILSLMPHQILSLRHQLTGVREHQNYVTIPLTVVTEVGWEVSGRVPISQSVDRSNTRNIPQLQVVTYIEMSMKLLSKWKIYRLIYFRVYWI